MVKKTNQENFDDPLIGNSQKDGDDVEINRLMSETGRVRSNLNDTIRKLATARGEYYSTGQSPKLRQSIETLEQNARDLLAKSQELTDQIQKLAGISDELIEAIEQNSQKGDDIDRIFRRHLTKEQIAPTDQCEDLLPEALEAIYRVVNKTWLDRERSKPYRFGEEFLKSPFSLVRGTRLESEYPVVHRFAQAIFISEDFLNHHTHYDFMAGALLVPQTVQLGLSLNRLKNVKGSDGRIRSLCKFPSDRADATIFELLVAAACAEYGRDMEFLSETSSISPDLRVHDYPFPTVVECKRKKPFSDYEREEERHMHTVFHALHDSVSRKGLWGVFLLSLKVDPENAPIQDIVDCAVRQRFSYAPHLPTEYSWGSISYDERPEKIRLRPTRLYSPAFLQKLFMWNSDLPDHDGIICQIKPTNDIIVDFAEEPVALLWKVTSARAIKKRSWTVKSLYTEAVQQVRPGEAGLFYLCYQEGTRDEISDLRLNEFVLNISSMDHSAAIRLPAFVLTRLYARPINDGVPDLIESGVRFLSSYADPVYFEDFPTIVFTRPSHA